MKILVVNPFGDTEFYGRDNLARIARPDTEFDVVGIGDMYPLRNNQWLYFRYMCTDGTLETDMKAEKQVYDAVFISSNLDIGLYEARQLVDIPVTATLESAALVAHMMGSTYSLVTVGYQNGKIQESLVRTYGLHEPFASQRPFDIDANDLHLKLSKYIFHDFEGKGAESSVHSVNLVRDNIALASATERVRSPQHAGRSTGRVLCPRMALQGAVLANAQPCP